MKRIFVIALLVAGTAHAAETAKSVTLDVKDEDVRVILHSMQQQCAIKNLIIDKEVSGKGTILFRAVPCETAFRVVFRSFGLAGQVYPNSVVTVSERPH